MLSNVNSIDIFLHLTGNVYKFRLIFKIVSEGKLSHLWVITAVLRYKSKLHATIEIHTRIFLKKRLAYSANFIEIVICVSSIASFLKLKK